MGVPGLFGWLRKKYPLIVRPASAGAEEIQGDGDSFCDNLYIDMNHVIHACTHPSWRCTPYLSEEEMFLDMQIYLDHLFNTARPRRLFMVAMDGVAPQAKMNQQRTRRFFSAYREELSKELEIEVRREMGAVLGPEARIPELPSFDGNVITPSTAFMARLAGMLRAFFAAKLGADPCWARCALLLSDSSEPGEGEHKIMRLIRHLRTLPGHDPNTRHVIYGQDADLILLALLTHEPHFAILREAHRDAAGDNADLKDMLVQQQPLEFLDISVLRQFLRHEFAELLAPKSVSLDVERPMPLSPKGEEACSTSGRSVSAADSAPAARDFEWLLEDFVQLTFLAGNDFLPNVPSLDIYDFPKSALDTLLESYKAVLPSSGYLTKGSRVVPSSLRALLNKLALDEQPAISRRQEQAMRQQKRQMQREAAANGADNSGGGGFTGPDQSGQWVSMGELRPGESLEEALSGLSSENGVTKEQQQQEWLRGASPEQLRQELASRVSKRLDDRLKGPALAEPITYRGSMSDFRARHYQQRFNAEPGEGVEKMARKVSQAYIQTLAWSLAYYCHGTLPVVRQGFTGAEICATSGSHFPCGAPWDWFYPYHYAPLMSDLAKHTGALGKIKSPASIQPEPQEPGGSWAPQYGPVRPLVQLMAVLPPQSAGCLPYKLARLLQEARHAHATGCDGFAAALADMFPPDLAPLIDMAGKRWAHTAVVKLPFADVKRLAAAAQQDSQDERELAPEEEARNEFGLSVLLLSGFHPLADRLRASAEGTPLQNQGMDDRSDQSDTEAVATLLTLAVQPEDPLEMQNAEILELALDLAGVATPPFSPHLLPGATEGEGSVTKRVWVDMQSAHRDKLKASTLNGNGRGRGRRSGRANGRASFRPRLSAQPPPPPPPRTAPSSFSHLPAAPTRSSVTLAAASAADRAVRAPPPGLHQTGNLSASLNGLRAVSSAFPPAQSSTPSVSAAGRPAPRMLDAGVNELYPGTPAPSLRESVGWAEQDALFSGKRSQSSASPLPSWLQNSDAAAAGVSGSSASVSASVERRAGGLERPAPAQQPDSFADIMSFLLPPAAAADGRDQKNVSMCSTSVTAVSASGDDNLGAAAVKQSVPAGMSLTCSNGNHNASKPADATAGALAHLLISPEPSAPFGLLGADCRKEAPRVLLPVVGPKRQAYNPMQARRPS